MGMLSECRRPLSSVKGALCKKEWYLVSFPTCPYALGWQLTRPTVPKRQFLWAGNDTQKSTFLTKWTFKRTLLPPKIAYINNLKWQPLSLALRIAHVRFVSSRAICQVQSARCVKSPGLVHACREDCHLHDESQSQLLWAFLTFDCHRLVRKQQGSCFVAWPRAP